MRVVFKSTVFLGVFSGLFWLLFIADNEYIEQKEAYRSAIQTFIRSDARCLILGDSHAVDALKSLGPSPYNLSFRGDTLCEMYFKLKYILGQGVVPAYVVVECDASIFFNDLKRVSPPRFVVPFVGDRAYEQAYGRAYLYAWLGYWLPVFDSKCLSFRRVAFNKRMHKAIGDVLDRAISVTDDENDDTGNHDLWSEQDDLFSVLGRSAYEDYFRGIVGLCRQHSVALVGVRFPHLAVAGTADASVAGDRTDERYRSFGFSQYLDYAALFSEKALFQDAGHLNDEGSRVFVRRLFVDAPRIRSIFYTTGQE